MQRIPSYQEYVNYIQQMSGGGYVNLFSTMQQPQVANVLPPQQVLQANGKASIDALRMSPNSSVYIEDSTNANILWKCASDGLGNVSSKPYDITPHEEAPILDTGSLIAIVEQLNDRLSKLEGTYASSSENTKPGTNRSGEKKSSGA